MEVNKAKNELQISVMKYINRGKKIDPGMLH